MRLGDLDALKSTINNAVDEEIRFDQAWAMGLKYSLKLIDNAPTVEPLYTITSNTFVEGASMRPQGEWIDCKDIPYLANCSHCGYQMDTHEERGYFRFCPYCGADMRGKEE